jgi:hypothetical protein
MRDKQTGEFVAIKFIERGEKVGLLSFPNDYAPEKRGQTLFFFSFPFFSSNTIPPPLLPQTTHIYTD